KRSPATVLPRAQSPSAIRAIRRAGAKSAAMRSAPAAQARNTNTATGALRDTAASGGDAGCVRPVRGGRGRGDVFMIRQSRVLRRNFDDYLKLMIPSRLYYSHKVAKGIRGAEPGLAILPDIVPAGCTAIDIGAYRGVYSYALSRIAGRVEAFDPNPVLAKIIAAKLAPKVRVHEVALSDHDGHATLYIPRSQ